MFITVQFDERTNVPKAKGKVYISSYERGQQDNISAKSIGWNTYSKLHRF